MSKTTLAKILFIISKIYILIIKVYQTMAKIKETLIIISLILKCALTGTEILLNGSVAK